MAQGFVEDLDCRIQNVARVIAGCLIPISTPPAKYNAAFNTWNCFDGVNLLAIVDSTKRFLWARGGLRGSMAGRRAFRESRWYEDQICERPKQRPGFVILADGGFALETWLLKPYRADQLTSSQKRMYNVLLCSPRAMVENAFGLLKGRWRVMNGAVFVETEFVPWVVEAFVGLHNDLLGTSGRMWSTHKRSPAKPSRLMNLKTALTRWRCNCVTSSLLHYGKSMGRKGKRIYKFDK